MFFLKVSYTDTKNPQITKKIAYENSNICR